ncbi:hypothetical protein BDW74DRAFT_174758 [Aspergillus multicolor]|uniref:uncharacterized protein n=1 Tax=Aspergillus multicolor TaxID=41759 RepID=UPI003CCE0990
MGSDDDAYVPPPEVHVRILGLRTGKVIIARENTDWIGNFEQEPVYPDSWFSLKDAGNGLHRIVSERDSYHPVLYSRQGPAPCAGQYAGGTEHDDQKFKFEMGSGLFSGYFRLVTPSEERVLTSGWGGMDNFWSGGGEYDDQ